MSEAQSPQANSGKELKLSTKGLQNVSSLGIQNFAIRAGEHAVACSRFEASFLSPRITAALLNDPTITEYEIDIEDCADFDPTCLSGLVSLSRNGSFVLTSSNFETVKCLVKGLANRDLAESLVEWERKSKDASCSEPLARLLFGELFDFTASDDIEHLASHFPAIDPAILISLSHDHLREIVHSEKLRLPTEDSLLDFLLDLGEGYFDLLGAVRTEWLTGSGIDRLLNSISVEQIDEGLWSSLCRRLRLAVRPSSIREARFSETFAFTSARPFDGVFAHLTRAFGGNVHTQGTVSITASSTSSHQCFRVVDADWSDCWYSVEDPGSWIQFDFKTCKIDVTDYSIKTNLGSHRLQKWSLAGSNDGQSWAILDQRDTKDLTGSERVKSYHCHSCGRFVRFIRLTQTGANSGGGHRLLLSNVELFGSLISL